MSNVVEFILRLKDMMSGGMQQAAATAQRAMSSTSRSVSQVAAAARPAATAVQRIPQAASSASGSIRSMANSSRKADVDLGRLERRGNSLGRSLRGLRGIAAGVSFAALGASVMSAGLQAQQQRATFEVMAGQQAGGQLFNNLTTFAQDSIFGNEVYQNAQTMKAFGMETAKVMPTMRMLGDVSMGNKDKLNSLTLAYSQIQSTGRLMGQDLLQLVNAGFNPLQVISDATGESMADLKKKMEQGAISAKAVEMAFQMATGPGGQFYNMTSKIAETDFGKLEALKGQLQGLAMQVGGALAPALGDLITNYLAPFVDWLSRTANWAQQNSSILLAVGGGIASVVAAMKIWTVVQTLLNVQLWAMAAALLANPITWIIAAIGLLVGALIYAWRECDTFRNIVTKVWESLKQFGTFLKDVIIGHIKDMLSGITGLGRALYLFFTGEWKQAWEVGKQAVVDISGINTVNQVFSGAKNVGNAWSDGVAKGIEEGKGAINRAATSAFNTPIRIGAMGIPSVMDLFKRNKGQVTGSDLAKELNGGGGGASRTGGSGGGRMSASGITSGGPRSITINVQKEMIGQLSINSYNVKEGVGEMEGMIEEGLRRILRSAATAS